MLESFQLAHEIKFNSYTVVCNSQIKKLKKTMELVVNIVYLTDIYLTGYVISLYWGA
jgi:hypothetical protein